MYMACLHVTEGAADMCRRVLPSAICDDGRGEWMNGSNKIKTAEEAA